MRLYTYVIDFDGGSAPNHDPPFTTLAVCKPTIRRCSREGNAVLAFTGKKLSREPHAVCWAGVIRKKLTFEKYWQDRNFQSKKPGRSATPDNFYEPVGEELRWVNNTTHDESARPTDLGGVFVLVLEPVWRFGKAGPILPVHFGVHMFGGRRGHRTHDLTDTVWEGLEKWLDSQPQRKSVAAPGGCKPSKSGKSAVTLPEMRKPGC